MIYSGQQHTSVVGIYNGDRQLVWECSVDGNSPYRQQAQYFQAKNLISRCENRFVGPLQGVFMPVRSDTAENFAIDFFLPTTMNYALAIRDDTIKYMAIKVISTIGAIVLDALTWGFRCLTSIYRVVDNFHRSKPELYYFLTRYLRVDAALITDSLWIQCQERFQRLAGSASQENSRIEEFYVEYDYPIALIELPHTPQYHQRYSSYSSGSRQAETLPT
jgi:hypothetical protein